MKRNPAGGALIEAPGGYAQDWGGLVGAGTLRPHDDEFGPLGLLQSAILERFGIPWCDVAGPSRVYGIAYARRLACYLLMEAGLTLMEIGRLLGGRHHATVLYGIHRIEAGIRYDRQVAEDADALRGACAIAPARSDNREGETGRRIA